MGKVGYFEMKFVKGKKRRLERKQIMIENETGSYKVNKLGVCAMCILKNMHFVASVIYQVKL